MSKPTYEERMSAWKVQQHQRDTFKSETTAEYIARTTVAIEEIDYSLDTRTPEELAAWLKAFSA